MIQEFPPRLENKFYLTEAGTETEVMYKWGYALPEFAMFPLLDNPEADECLRGMYRRYFDVAAVHGTGLLLTGHDYRASPDWAGKLGYSLAELADFQHRTIRFLTDMRAEHEGRVSDVYVAGCIGPRGDAYGTGAASARPRSRTITRFSCPHCERVTPTWPLHRPSTTSPRRSAWCGPQERSGSRSA